MKIALKKLTLKVVANFVFVCLSAGNSLTLCCRDIILLLFAFCITKCILLKNELKYLHCCPKFISTDLIISSGMFKIVIFTNYVFACTKSTHHLIHLFSNEFCVNFDIVYTIPPRSSIITLQQTCRRIRRI